MSKVKASDLYFLVLHWLKSGPCQSSADALERELLARNLLPTLPSLGTPLQPDYATLCRWFDHVPPSSLRELVEECIQLQREGGASSSAGPLSLLEATGSLSYIPSVRTRLTPSTVTVPPPSQTPCFLQRLFQRENGCPRRPLRNAQLIDGIRSSIYERLQHVKTLRGHRKAVYCVAIDHVHDRVITGADDGVIKIWNLKVGLLITTCRGHLGEIGDMKINCDHSFFASASNDGTTRIWSLKDETLGHHVRALLGHQMMVTFISWHPFIASALLTVSLDGTVRLWHAQKGIELIRAKPLGTFSHFYNRNAFERSLDQAMTRQREAPVLPVLTTGEGLTCCVFSPSGEHFAVSSLSGKCFVWHWNVIDIDEETTWPDASLMIELEGHERCVPLLLFDHQGNSLCSASLDGTVKIWRPFKNRSSSGLQSMFWKERWSFGLPDPIPFPTTHSRRRKTSPECNQIAWSCDDQFLMAAYSCGVVMVWNATNGTEENVLYGGHSDSPVHVLVAHPLDSKLCFSAGYDGKLVLWDILNGQKIKTLSSQDTHPGRFRWADPIQFTDGQVLRDGTGIIVTDVAGQFHIYGMDPPSKIIRKTPYDQFFLYDYDRVLIGDDGEPVDMESGEPQHVHRMRFSMVDITDEPYDPALQEILTTGKHLHRLSDPSDPPQTPKSLIVLPPTMSAAFWYADDAGLGPQATATRVTAAQQRQIALMQEMGGDEGMADILPLVQAEEPPEAPDLENDEESDGSEYTPDEAEPINSPLAIRSDRIVTRATDASPIGRRRIPTRLNPELPERIEFSEVEEDFPETDDEEEELSDMDTFSSDVEIQERTISRGNRERSIHIRVETRRPARRQRRLALLYTPPVEENRRNQPSDRSRRAARRAAVAQASRIVIENRPPTSSSPAPVVNEVHHTEFATGRDLSAYKWLSETRRHVGYYVPQMNEAVVFFPTLYGRFCEEHSQLAIEIDACFLETLRFAEPCEVIDISFEIFRGIDLCPTVARVKLRLTETNGYDESILDVTIPPPSFGHEEFVISRRLFLQSMNREWYTGQQCKVFYFGERQEWWKGQIIEDRLMNVSAKSIWQCEHHYRRYCVRWTDHKNTQPEQFSPWELAMPSSDESSSRSVEAISLNDALRRNLLRALAIAKDAPEAAHFRDTLAPMASFSIPGRLRQDSLTLFYNQVVPLPMSLKLIKARLQHPTYYSSFEAFKFDVHLIVQNAHAFTEPNSVVCKQADALEQIILESIESQTESSEPSSSEESSGSILNACGFHGVLASTRSPSMMTSLSTREPSNASSFADYQIRTRGMAKRERQPENRTYQRCTRRRRYA